jgi:hypothetical protein
MMAGTFLDVESARDQARAQLAEARLRIKRDPAAGAQREHDRLADMGFSEADATSVVAAIQRTPQGALRFASAFELQVADAARRIPWFSRSGCSSWICAGDLPLSIREGKRIGMRVHALPEPGETLRTLSDQTDARRERPSKRKDPTSPELRRRRPTSRPRQRSS